MSGQIIVAPVGLLECVVCAPLGTTREQVEAAANRDLPTGISSGWSVSDEKIEGQDQPVACLQEADRRHWLLKC